MKNTVFVAGRYDINKKPLTYILLLYRTRVSVSKDRYIIKGIFKACHKIYFIINKMIRRNCLCLKKLIV